MVWLLAFLGTLGWRGNIQQVQRLGGCVFTARLPAHSCQPRFGRLANRQIIVQMGEADTAKAEARAPLRQSAHPSEH
jgi:hypothetical protein